MSLKNSIQAVTLATFDAATLTNVFQPVNIGGLSHPCFRIRISNFSTVGLTFSVDGVNDTDIMNPDQAVELPGGNSASSPQNNCALWGKGTIVYVRGPVAGAGIIAVSGYYQNQGA